MLGWVSCRRVRQHGSKPDCRAVVAEAALPVVVDAHWVRRPCVPAQYAAQQPGCQNGTTGADCDTGLPGLDDLSRCQAQDMNPISDRCILSLAAPAVTTVECRSGPGLILGPGGV